MATVKRGANFPAELTTEIFSKVRGHSSLAKLSPSIPVSFSGTDEFTFAMDNEISLVGESGAKPDGGFTVSPVSVVPKKVIYQGRVSDEFMYCSEERKIEILTAFAAGMERKVGRGLDLMAIHGIDPKSNIISSLITNYFDTTVTNTATFDGSHYSTAIEAAVSDITDNEYQPNGIILGPTFAAGLAGETDTDKGEAFAALKWGGNPDMLMGLGCDVNPTVSKAVKATAEATAAKVDEAIIGDFSTFRWGFAKDIGLEVIEYGNPDGGTYDLKQANEVCLRAEAYIGFAILDKNAFSRVVPAASI